MREDQHFHGSLRIPLDVEMRKERYKFCNLDVQIMRNSLWLFSELLIQFGGSKKGHCHLEMKLSVIENRDTYVISPFCNVSSILRLKIGLTRVKRLRLIRVATKF